MTEEGTRTSKGQIVSDSRESNDNRAVGAQAPAARVRLKRLPHAEGLELPSLATPGSAGVDLAAAIEGKITIAPGGRDIVPTGFMLAIPAGFEGQVDREVVLPCETASWFRILRVPLTRTIAEK